MSETSAGKPQPEAIPLNIYVHRKTSFDAPFFWGTQKRGLLLPKRVAALWEGTPWCKGGTGKAEAAKLPDAGISLSGEPKENEGRRKGNVQSQDRREEETRTEGRLRVKVCHRRKALDVANGRG
jgi:hypothetical protein